ncbi:hypothetical protein AB1Y20_018460 [Prymnesium parvum]|uniref:Uncharacterized protein n=1 Tax=Prymnesium parvum TaxID=97485 RepID=A0AB34JRS5_PRYPA
MLYSCAPYVAPAAHEEPPLAQLERQLLALRLSRADFQLQPHERTVALSAAAAARLDQRLEAIARAAAHLQRRARGAAARKRTRRLTRAATLVQAASGGMRKAAHARRHRLAATRAALAARGAARAAARRHAAARLTRGGRRAAAARRARREGGALALQAAARGMRARRAFARRLAAARAREARAARQIQRAARGRAARRVAAVAKAPLPSLSSSRFHLPSPLLLSLHIASPALCGGSNALPAGAQRERDAAVTLQRFTRTRIRRKRTAERLARRRVATAARKVNRSLRMWMFRSRFLRLRNAALRLQAAARRLLERNRSLCPSELREAYHRRVERMRRRIASLEAQLREAPPAQRRGLARRLTVERYQLRQTQILAFAQRRAMERPVAREGPLRWLPGHAEEGGAQQLSAEEEALRASQEVARLEHIAAEASNVAEELAKALRRVPQSMNAEATSLQLALSEAAAMSASAEREAVAARQVALEAESAAQEAERIATRAAVQHDSRGDGRGASPEKDHLNTTAIAAGATSSRMLLDELEGAMEQLHIEIDAHDTTEAKRYALRRQLLRLRSQHKKVKEEEAQLKRKEEEEAALHELVAYRGRQYRKRVQNERSPFGLADEKERAGLQTPSETSTAAASTVSEVAADAKAAVARSATALSAEAGAAAASVRGYISTGAWRRCDSNKRMKMTSKAVLRQLLEHNAGSSLSSVRYRMLFM